MDSASSFQSAKDAWLRRLARLGVRAEDLIESFTRSSGPGGQNVNKVSTAVTLRHEPSGLSVTVQDSRSQAMNRQIARERLTTLMEQRERERRAALKAAREKVRRQKAQPPRGVKKRMVEGKRRRGATKKMRGNVGEE